MPSPAHRGRPPHDDVLTPAEWRVVHAVQHGLSNRQIAVRRGISVDAVKQHVANAVAKLGVADRKGLRRWSGAPKRSALRSQEQPMETTLQLGPIGQVSRTVSDIAAAESWYGKVLGLNSRGVPGASVARRRVHRRAPSHSQARRRDRGVDGVLQGPGRSPARRHFAAEALTAFFFGGGSGFSRSSSVRKIPV